MAIRGNSSISVPTELFVFSLTNIINLTFLSGNIPTNLPLISDPFIVVDSYIVNFPYARTFALMVPIILGLNFIFLDLYKSDRFRSYRSAFIMVSVVSILYILYEGWVLYGEIGSSPYALPYFDFILFGHPTHLFIFDMFFLAYIEVLFTLYILWYILAKIEHIINNLTN